MSEPARILVSGANGFVGGAVVRRLDACGRFHPVAACRLPPDSWPEGIETCRIGDISQSTDWTQALRGVDAVIHAAARVHLARDKAVDPLALYRQVNVEGSLNLARQAAQAGVRRFVYLSSIKVMGEATPPGSAFTPEGIPAPQDDYGVSKMEAEAGLKEIAHQTGIEVVIIRPPLVYGPGVRANFLSMMRWVRRGMPLPLGAVQNRRSFVGLDNLVDLIFVCIDHPKAANQVFHVSDGEDLSTPDWMRRLGAVMGCPVRLFAVPVVSLALVARMTGRQGYFERLCASLQVDISKNAELLGWSPPHSVDDCLRAAVAGFSRPSK